MERYDLNVKWVNSQRKEEPVAYNVNFYHPINNHVIL